MTDRAAPANARLAALNSLHRGQVLAASMPSSRVGCRGWVGVYPLTNRRETLSLLRRKGQPIPLPAVRVYRIRQFEVDRTLIERGISIGEPELENQADLVVSGDEELIEKLLLLGMSIDQLELPYKSDYPI